MGSGGGHLARKGTVSLLIVCIHVCSEGICYHDLNKVLLPVGDQLCQSQGSWNLESDALPCEGLPPRVLSSSLSEF